MTRGTRKFNKLLANDSADPMIEEKRRGRSSHLINYRNTAIAYRYYYHARIHKKRYDDILEILSKEFMIAPYTIAKILTSNDELIQPIFKSNPDFATMKKLFPFFTWLPLTINQ